MTASIEFVRLTDIPTAQIAAHMSDPRVAAHMPLLTPPWTEEDAALFVAAKEETWKRDGLGHWAFLQGRRYVGWGGFQKEAGEWDFGLVLKPDAFGLGQRIAKQALVFARKDERIPFVTFLLPPSRRHLGALGRLGAEYIGDIDYEDKAFRKYRLNTPLAEHAHPTREQVQQDSKQQKDGTDDPECIGVA